VGVNVGVSVSVGVGVGVVCCDGVCVWGMGVGELHVGVMHHHLCIRLHQWKLMREK